MASRPPAAPTLAELQPMLLCERKTIPREPGWHYEIKYDGYRMLAATGEAPRLKSKNGADVTTWFPEVVRILAELPSGHILDGEACVLDDIGRSDFERLPPARGARAGPGAPTRLPTASSTCWSARGRICEDSRWSGARPRCGS